MMQFTPCATGFPTNTTARLRKVAHTPYHEAFVDALTKAGWVAALIPQQYGCSGLGLPKSY
jgi:alkylation response protein AidB-like acyl-CoA dehydrogenase